MLRRAARTACGGLVVAQHDVTHLLPVVLERQLPLEVAGVGDVLQLAEQIATRQHVHRAYM